MSASPAPIMAQLEQEDAAWRDLPPADYDRAICAMFEALDAAPEPIDRAALLDLSEAILGRDDPALTESRGCAAGPLLALIREAAEPDLRRRAERLFLLAWKQLCAAAALGPDSISVTPELPAGVQLPRGADPAAIADPVLRAQALELADRHREAAAQWNAKQRALDHLRSLAATRADAGPGKNALPETLIAAMSHAPGLPPDIARSLVGKG